MKLNGAVKIFAKTKARTGIQTQECVALAALTELAKPDADAKAENNPASRPAPHATTPTDPPLAHLSTMPKTTHISNGTRSLTLCV